MTKSKTFLSLVIFSTIFVHGKYYTTGSGPMVFSILLSYIGYLDVLNLNGLWFLQQQIV